MDGKKCGDKILEIYRKRSEIELLLSVDPIGSLRRGDGLGHEMLIHGALWKLEELRGLLLELDEILEMGVCG